MKLIFLTQEYGGRAAVRVTYAQMFYFAGKQPDLNALITVELPGLTEYVPKTVSAWLKKHANETLKTVSATSVASSARREINEFPEAVWRATRLDDYLEAHNYSETVWQVSQQFSPTDFAAFGDKWLGAAQQKLHRATNVVDENERVRAFEGITNLQERVYSVMDKVPYNLRLEIARIAETFERRKFDEMRRRTNNLEEWIKIAGRFESNVVRLEAASLIADEITARKLDSKEINRLLNLFSSILHYSISYHTVFWEKLAPLIKLEQNVTGKTLDLTEANEETVQLGWEILNARRVGQIVPGRTALVVRSKKNNAAKLFVRGERRLKFQIERCGGEIKKFGCTLTLAKREEAKSIQPALLEVEKIDALANLSVDQALKTIAHLNLSSSHLIYRTAEAARKDARQARVLADLLIELVIGVDADVARRLARNQARANRQ